MSQRSLLVRKADGKLEPFEPFKLQSSLLRSGAKPAVADEIVDEVIKKFKSGSSTKSIYRNAFSLLKTRERGIAAKYSLRRAISDLGPSGFPFEQMLARIYEEKGYETRTGVTVKGNCIPHEIDVIAVKNDEVLFIEAKFHNDDSLKSDSKTALYVKARYDDLKDIRVEFSESVGEVTMTKGMLVTNTKFSSSAMQYAECLQLPFIGWSYPKNNGLQNMIEESGLHPVTSLTTLSKAQENILLQENIVVCKDLLLHNELLDATGISEEQKKEVMREVDEIIKTVS
jgi:Holliday junction resolvase